jgi:hypothetical protein
MVGLGDVVSRSLDGGRRLKWARREEAPSGAIVVSSAGSTKFMWILTLKIAWRFVGDDDICSVYMRRTRLRVC